MKTFLALLLLCAACHPVCAEESIPRSFMASSEETIGEIDIMHHQAEDQILKNDFKEAIQILDGILLLEPDDEIAYAQMGHCYMILGDYIRAEQAFQNALHINPENETALLGIQKIHDPDGVLMQKEIPLDESVSADEAVEPAAMPEPAMQPISQPLPHPTLQPPALAVPESLAALAPPIQVEIVKISSFEENIQRALKNAGLYEGPLDGSIGPASRKAIETFQSSRGLKVDGKVGPETWKALQGYLALENSAPQQA